MLTDETKVGSSAWKNLKEQAMDEDYENTEWFDKLKPDDKDLLEALIFAQKK